MNYGFNQFPQYGMNVQQPSTDDRIWVQGRNSAEAYLMTPNSFVRLWDSQKPIFYEKRTDASGRPIALDAYEYTLATSEPESAVISEDTSKLLLDEIEALKERITALEGKKKKGAKDE